MRKTILVLTLLALVCGPVVAQRTTATIRGTITDVQGEAIPGATITAVNVETGFNRVVTSTAAGTYNIPELPVGTYVVTVELEGFKTSVVQNVVLNVADTRQVDSTMEIGAVTEAVTVTSSAVVVETIGGEVAGLITGEQVRELPLNGRNFLQLTQLMPGVTTLDNFNAKNKGLLTGSDISVAGGRTTGNLWSVDGANNNDVGSNRTILVYPSLEAVEEFKIHRNSYGAEFGGAGGAQVNLVTRGGTNNLRGSVFYFGRRGSWNETNYILRRVDAEADDLTRDDYGFTLGGAFIKDKLHFFGSTEWNDEVRGIAASAQVPTAAEKRGDFSQSNPACRPIPIDPLTGNPFPNNIIPADRLDEAGLAWVQLWPDENTVNADDPCRNWFTSIDTPIDWAQINARLDWTITDRARFMVRYTEDAWENPSPTAGSANGLWGDDSFPAIDSAWDQPSQSLVAQLNNVIGSASLNTFTYSMSGNEILIGQTGTNPNLQGDIRSTFTSAFPAEDKLSYPQTGHPVFWGGQGLDAVWQQGPWNNDMDIMVLKDDYEQVFGQHVLKVGISYTDSKKQEIVQGASDEFGRYWGSAGIGGWGATSGNLIADFLLDDMTFGFSEVSRTVNSDLSWTDLEVYVADSWKIRDNVTFDFGVRYSRFDWPENSNSSEYLNFNPALFDPAVGATPCNGLMQVPGSDPCGAAGFAGASTGPNAALVNNNDYFAPRLGLAWDVFRNGKSVLRAGFGQFYQRERVSPHFSLTGNPPAVKTTGGIRDWDGENEFLDFVGDGRPAGGVDVNAETPNMYQYNLTWEQRVGRDSTIEVSYVGSQGNDLLRATNINQVPLGQDLDGNGVNDRLDYIRCDPNDQGCRSQYLPISIYGDAAFNIWGFNGSSEYNSLQTQFITRFGRGSQLQASYTLADFTADTHMSDSSGAISDDNSITDLSQPGLDDRDSDMRRRHVFNASAIYNLPTFAGQGGAKEWLLGNWAVGGIVIYSSGQPITVYAADPQGELAGTAPAANGPYEGNVRALRTGASCSGAGGLQVLNPAAYTLVGYELGNSAQQAERNACDGPDFFQFDLSIYKNFPFRDRFNVQLRFEVFNLFNNNNLVANSVNRSYNPFVTLDAARDQATRIVSESSLATNFGQVSAARDARQIQLGVKFSF